MLILGVFQIAWRSHCRWFLSERNGAADSQTLPVNVLRVVDLCYWTVPFSDVKNGGFVCLNDWIHQQPWPALAGAGATSNVYV